MNRAIHKMTDEERAAEEAMIRRIMHEAVFFDNDEEREAAVQGILESRTRRRIPWGVLAYAASLCVVVAWLALSGVL